jgi:Cu/Ag efflux protein CusF
MSDTDVSKMRITLSTKDASKVGIYAMTLDVALKDFTSIPKITMSFKVTIFEQPRNNLPYFETLLPA